MYQPTHLAPQHRRRFFCSTPFMSALVVIVALMVLVGSIIFINHSRQNAAQQQALAAAWQEIGQRTVVLTSAGKKDMHASPAQIRSWAQLQPAAPQNGKPQYQAYFQENLLAKWVQESAKTLEVTPKNGKREVDASGHLVRLLQDPVSGMKVSNTSECVKTLINLLKQGKPEAKADLKVAPAPGGFDDTVVVAPPLAYQANPAERWVDVNLSTHTTAVYQGNQPIFGPVPVINGHPNGPTRQGIFKVYIKLEQQVMRGVGWDGQPYAEAAPWIAYFNGNYALHGAPWRQTFVWNPDAGSHGCINMSVDDAKQIFDLVNIGTTVVVHE